jgi:hypothetical protein
MMVKILSYNQFFATTQVASKSRTQFRSSQKLFPKNNLVIFPGIFDNFETLYLHLFWCFTCAVKMQCLPFYKSCAGPVESVKSKIKK